MTYEEVLDFLFSQLPMYQKVGKTAFKKNLSNTIALCKALGHPERAFRSIHIAGTNGKGSTAHMMAGMLQAAGLKVGLYTSPHYRDYRERIKINGRYISQKAVIDFVKDNKAAIEDIQPSFFEMTVGLAFDYFAKEQVDIAVIETGLGGRLDSTNVINPLISVITNIGLDHQTLLGDTIPLIAAEKAGIIKTNTPVIVGIRQAETADVFQAKAEACKANLTYAEEVVLIEVQKQAIDRTDILVHSPVLLTPMSLSIPSGVDYNVENCRTAIAAFLALSGKMNIDPVAIITGLADFQRTTKYMGRWQIKSSEPLILLDAAHNVDGINTLFGALGVYTFTKMHIILGMVSDKSSRQILELLPKEAKYYFTRPEIPRGKDKEELKAEAMEYGLRGRSYKSCKHALVAAKRGAQVGDLILATGSSFVVAELV